MHTIESPSNVDFLSVKAFAKEFHLSLSLAVTIQSLGATDIISSCHRIIILQAKVILKKYKKGTSDIFKSSISITQDKRLFATHVSLDTIQTSLTTPRITPQPQSISAFLHAHLKF